MASDIQDSKSAPSKVLIVIFSPQVSALTLLKKSTKRCLDLHIAAELEIILAPTKEVLLKSQVMTRARTGTTRSLKYSA